MNNQILLIVFVIAHLFSMGSTADLLPQHQIAGSTGSDLDSSRLSNSEPTFAASRSSSAYAELNCTGLYAELYCLHDGYCRMYLTFDGKTTPLCHCQSGYYGRRCENIDFAERWLPAVFTNQNFIWSLITAIIGLIIIVAGIAACVLCKICTSKNGRLGIDSYTSTATQTPDPYTPIGQCHSLPHFRFSTPRRSIVSAGLGLNTPDAITPIEFV